MAKMTTVYRNGRKEIIPGTAHEASIKESEDERRAVISSNRAYVAGAQFDEANAKWRDECGIPEWKPTPEHDRSHAYSVQIAESVEFVANQITDGLRIKCKDEQVQDLFDRAVAATDMLTTAENEHVNLDPVILDAGVSGDVPYRLRWDPAEQTPWYEFWPAEHVDFDVPAGDTPRKVTAHDTVWLDRDGEEKEYDRRRIWELADRDDTVQCRVDTFIGEDDEPDETVWLPVPFIPWHLVRIDSQGLRGFRGRSLISEQARHHADRYNANEQNSYLIARYNSHGNLAVVGDFASMQMESKGEQGKDVADALYFPGGTAVQSITLPTDPQMIEHQRTVLADAIYSTFGLARVDAETMKGVGQLSGYALEILNRRTDGTFRKIRRTLRRDLANMIRYMVAFSEAMLNATPVPVEYESEEAEDAADEREQDGYTLGLPGEADEVEVDIRLGSGYIVDDVALRDDYTAGLISRKEVLRQRGYTDERIRQVEREIEADEPEGSGPGDIDGAAAEAARQAVEQNGQQQQQEQQQETPQSTQAPAANSTGRS